MTDFNCDFVLVSAAEVREVGGYEVTTAVGMEIDASEGISGKEGSDTDSDAGGCIGLAPPVLVKSVADARPMA